MIDELLAQFLIEGREQASQASADLAALRRAPADAARLDGCFRAVHTLKGSADLLGLKALGRVLHVAEDRLGALRNGAGGGAGLCGPRRGAGSGRALAGRARDERRATRRRRRGG